ncbi:MAG: TetR/AcrR family transcriptional regulator [Gaiellales bacterium]
MGHSVKERVIAGARRAIEDVGWQAATLEQIASAAGLSRMTLHRHGFGRDEIFALLAAAYEADFHAFVERACGRAGSPVVRLEAGLRAVCEATERHLAFLAGLDDEADTRLFHDDGVSRPGYVSPIEEVLAAGVGDGSFTRVDVSRMAVLLVNAADRTYRHLRAAHGWSPDEAAEAIELLVGGLASR